MCLVSHAADSWLVVRDSAIRRLRRGLRDVRDRMVRSQRRWRTVCFAGMVCGDRTGLVLVIHEGIDRREVDDVLRSRWLEVVLKDLEGEQPATAMSLSDAADLGRCHRGVEPLRIVIMPQHDPHLLAPVVEPMPVLV